MLENVIKERNTDVNIFNVEQGMSVADMVNIVNQSRISAILLDLRKELRTSYFTALTMFLMFMIGVYLLVFVTTDKWALSDFEIVLIFGSMVAFFLNSDNANY